MSYTVSTLLLRNLHNVFEEIDPVRRRRNECGGTRDFKRPRHFV
jgi:hypothetical protein